MEGKDENKPKIVYFILAVFIHANVFLPFLSERQEYMEHLYCVI